MSNERRAWSWRHGLLKSDLPSTTRHVLLTLSCHVNDAGEPCFPSIEQLAQETGLTTRSVMKQLSIGKETGWIVVGKHGYAGQKWARREYQIAWPETPEGGERGSRTNDEGGERGSRKVVNVVHVADPDHIYGFSHSLLNNTSDAGVGGAVPAFDRFWQAWPQSMHKKYKAECRRKWERMKLDREIDLVLAHVANVIAKSDAAMRDGGQYLVGPRSYITNAEWRELGKFDATVTDIDCKKCGALANYKRGGTWLCQTHFNEREED